MDVSSRDARTGGPYAQSRRVSQSDFIALLTSRRQLTRLDDLPNNVRGLVDDDGTWFVIDTATLATPAGRRVARRGNEAPRAVPS